MQAFADGTLVVDGYIFISELSYKVIGGGGKDWLDLLRIQTTVGLSSPRIEWTFGLRIMREVTIKPYKPVALVSGKHFSPSCTFWMRNLESHKNANEYTIKMKWNVKTWRFVLYENGLKYRNSGILRCQRPYHAEHTGSRLITAVKQRWALLVLGWVTAWEHHVLLVFLF